MVRLSPVPPQAQSIVIPQDRPVYRVKGSGFFGPDDTWYAPESYIALQDEPNQDMEPMNALAQEKMATFLKKLDAAGRVVAEKTGKAWNSLADAHENAYALAQKESKTFESLSASKQVPLMRAKKNGGAIEKIDVSANVPLLGTKGKLSLGAKNEVVKE